MLLEALILASEKAANIARKCRDNEHLFQLLIQEKKADEANSRFVQDFKTLADVLIQETLRHDIATKYPTLRAHIRGEESSVFCNTLGESIAVRVEETPDATAALLAKVLEDDWEAARLLAEEVHRNVRLADVNVAPINMSIDSGDEVGIWIDPIDSTAEYISGVEEPEAEGLATRGLKCVTVLIGVFNRNDGQPIIGVVNQPFSRRKEEKWCGECFWGVSLPHLRKSSLMPTPTSGKTICLSNSEDASIKRALQEAGYSLLEVAGAGYKLLLTAMGIADLYVLSKSSTFQWDTCGPHALLRSLHGDIVPYKDAVESKSIVYHSSGQGCASHFQDSCCNRDGIIAFRDRGLMLHVVDVLKQAKH